MPLIYGRAGVTKPSESNDGVATQPQLDEFGAIHVRNETFVWTDQGSYFKSCNPTMGTGIAMGIQTTFSDTANVLLIMRNSSSTVKVYPHYIRLVCTAAGASTTASNLAVVLDTANRYSSGGTDLTTSAVNANTGSSAASVVDVLRFGAVTGAAASAKRQVGRCMLKTQAAACWTVGDEVLIHFGPQEYGVGFVSGTAATNFVKGLGPVVLGGQNHCMLLHMWNVANATTPPSWEVECAWWER